MKAALLLVGFAVLIIAATVVVAPEENAEPVEPMAAEVSYSGPVFAIRHLKFKEGVDIAEFEQFILEEYGPIMGDRFPGLDGYFLKGDRGEDVGGYVWLMVMDSKNTRDWLFPADGSVTQFQVLMETCGETCTSAYDKFVSYFVEGGPYTDYVALE
jgi:hypothetical protein